MAEKKQRIWIGQCIGTIIFSIITFLTALIPYSIKDGVTLSINYMPLFGNGVMKLNQLGVVNNIGLIGGIPNFIFGNNVLILNIILMFNVFFSLLLIITRSNVLRIIVKIFSIILGVFLIIIAISYIVITVSIIYALFSGYFPLNDILSSVMTSGIIYYFVTLFFIIVLAGKQFRWYTEREW